MFTSLLSQLPFDRTMLAILAAFAVTYWAAKRFFFIPILDLLEEREREISSGEEAFQSARADVEAELEAQRVKMAEERGQARTERDAIRREALSAREEIVVETQRLAEEKLETARIALDEVLATEKGLLDAKANELADAMLEKILRKAS